MSETSQLTILVTALTAIALTILSSAGELAKVAFEAAEVSITQAMDGEAACSVEPKKGTTP